MTVEHQPTPAVELGGVPIKTQSSRGSAEVHVVVAYHGNTATIVALDAETLGPAGHLIWTIEKPGGRDADAPTPGTRVGEVNSIWVEQRRQGKGIATCLYREAGKAARERGWPAEIDHNRRRTDKGDRWARQVGGYLPEREAVNDDETLRRLFGG